MAKGKGTGRGNHFWRNKIKNERKSPNFRFRGRVRSKGESKVRSSSGPPQKGQNWTNKIKSERTPTAKIQRKKATPKPVKSGINRVGVKPYVIPRQKSLTKPVKARQVTKPKETYVASNRVRQPVTNKKSIDLLKKRQAAIKTPEQGSHSKNLKAGISKLKSAALKNQPVRSTNQPNLTPSKGASMLKKNATSIGNMPRNIKKVKQPVIRRGR